VQPAVGRPFSAKNYTRWVELRGGDIVLRPWRPADVPAVLAACRDPEIPRWIPFVPAPYSEDDALSYVRGAIESGDDRHAFAIVAAEGAALYGSIDMRVNAMRTGHIGYWVAREARGRGVCTAALGRLCRFALEDLRLERLELMTDPENVASQRVAEKVGFRREGVLRSHLLHRDGRRRDSVMFSFLPGELA
jgi:RimJ/RimL family protein N-acetyltransferase